MRSPPESEEAPPDSGEDTRGVPVEIIERFRGLAVERLTELERGWQGLFEGTAPAPEELSRDLRGLLHTFKGECRVIGFTDVHFLCHKMEELWSFAEERAYRVPDNFDLVVTMAFQFMAVLVRKEVGRSLGGIDLPGFAKQIDDVLIEARRTLSISPEASETPRGRARGAHPAEVDRLEGETLRELASAATRVFVEHHVAQGPSRERLSGIWRTLNEALGRVGAADLSNLLERHRDTVSTAAVELHKKVRYELARGEEICVAPEVAAALDTAALHVLSNAVVHGIEEPEYRTSAGKPAEGRITVALDAGDGHVDIRMMDDGAGLDPDSLFRRAVAMGFLGRATGRDRVDDRELLELIFRPGFSTRAAVSGISGRGIGLDAVRRVIERVGGAIHVESAPGQGTSFVLRVPVLRDRLPVACIGSWRGCPLAVPGDMEVRPAHEGDTGEAYDPDVWLGVEEPSASGSIDRWLWLEGRNFQGRVRWSGEELVQCEAERAWPAAKGLPVEVVRVRGVEGLLLWPDRLSEGSRG